MPATVNYLTLEEAVKLVGTFHRVAIVGGPGSGKTTFAGYLNHNKVHSDAYMTSEWDDQRRLATEAVLDLEHHRADWCVEGVTVTRCLANDDFRPDVVVWLQRSYRGDDDKKGVKALYTRTYNALVAWVKRADADQHLIVVTDG